MTAGSRDDNEITFAEFRFNPATGSLGSPGTHLKLRPQATALLHLLLSHPNQTLSRTEIRQHIWPERAVVEFDQAITTTIKELRKALGESARRQRLIVTVPAKGYRFVAPAQPEKTKRKSYQRHPLVRIVLVAIAFIALAVITFQLLEPQPPNQPKPRVAILPFDDLREVPDQTLPIALQHSLIGHMGRIGSSSLTTIARRPIMKAVNDRQTLATALNADFIVEGDLRIAKRSPADDLLIATVSLISTEDDSYLWGEVMTHPISDPLLVDRISARTGEALAAALGLGELVIPELLVDE